MRLYKITAVSTTTVGDNDSLLRRKTVWVGSKAEGVDARKALYLEGFARKEVNEVEVDVPTDKAGLLAFLNENVR